MTNQSDSDKEYEEYLKNRVRLRCTNRECELASGFWTAKTFVQDRLETLGCILCKSKTAHALEEVKDEEK